MVEKTLDVEVIVNAWNRNILPRWLLLPQAASGAIRRRGGTGPLKELRKYGPIPLDGARRVPEAASMSPSVASIISAAHSD